MSSKAPQRWTKKEIAAMRSALDTFALMYKPHAGEAWTIWLAKHRGEIVSRGVASMRDMHAERVEKELGFVEHVKANPHIYPGNAAVEIAARSDVTLARERKNAAWFGKLAERIGVDGLPTEVAGYDPIAERVTQ